MIEFKSPLEVCLHVVSSFLGRPYTWGGDDPMAGFDCSGLCIEGLKAAGLVARGGWDTTADGLMKDCGWNAPATLEPGCLVFWGASGRATHVEMVIGQAIDQVWTIGASGGGRETRTQDDAIRMNAFIKIRPCRPGYIAARDPFEEWR